MSTPDPRLDMHGRPVKVAAPIRPRPPFAAPTPRVPLPGQGALFEGGQA